MNNRILGFIGSGLLILGIFLPIISVMGLLTFSLFTFIQGSMPGIDPTGMVGLFRIIGIAVLLLGIASLVLTLKNQFRLLIATGVISMCVLALIFIKLQSVFSNIPEEARMLSGAIGTGWGLYAMILGAIALIVAGAMKNTATVTNTGYGAPPPPPYPPVG
jgi:hypothetical protein